MAFTLDIGGKEIPAKVNFWTLVLYEQEFGADLIQEFFWKSKVTAEEEGEYVLDFTRTNWTAVVKAAWACIKTANPGYPPFRVWGEEQDTIDLIAVRDALYEPLRDAYFRFWGSGSPEKQPR